MRTKRFIEAGACLTCVRSATKAEVIQTVSARRTNSRLNSITQYLTDGWSVARRPTQFNLLGSATTIGTMPRVLGGRDVGHHDSKQERDWEGED